MGSKSQRRKERHAQRRKEKRKQQEQSRVRQGILRHDDIPIGSNVRHRQRLTQQIPLAWPGEMSEDVAVFDDAVLSWLPPDLVPQVTAVREALQEALASRGDDALKRVSAIPRGSPLSEWRLFIRGLIDWLAGDTAAAGEAWKRLDPERRPGRIATAMMVALRSDLEHVSPHLGQHGQDETGRRIPGVRLGPLRCSTALSRQALAAGAFRPGGSAGRRDSPEHSRGVEGTAPGTEENSMVEAICRGIRGYGTGPDGCAGTNSAGTSLRPGFQQPVRRCRCGHSRDRDTTAGTGCSRFSTTADSPRILPRNERRSGRSSEYLNRDLPQNEALSESAARRDRQPHPSERSDGLDAARPRRLDARPDVCTARGRQGHSRSSAGRGESDSRQRPGLQGSRRLDPFPTG